jgi:hypothetical protein
MYSTFNQHPRNYILVKKGFQLQPLMHRCSRDITAVKNTSHDGGSRETVLESALHLYDDVGLPPSQVLERGDLGR